MGRNQKAKIKQDSHSLYVRTNGSVYRPVPAKWSYPHPSAIDPADPYKGGRATTRFHEGDEVIVSNQEQSPFCTLLKPSIPLYTELWHSHGTYYREDLSTLKKSDEVWEPKEEKSNVY